MSEGTDITSFKKVYRTRSEGDFPEKLVIELQKEWDLKYAENPHQHGAIYSFSKIAGKNASKIAELTNLLSVRSDGKGKGGLSLTNVMDISRAMDTLKYFPDPACIIMKHTIVSGFSVKNNEDQKQADLFRKARECDRRSNFGGTAVFNTYVDMETAESLYELKGESPFFVDVLAAPGFDEGVLDYIEKQSKNIRIGEFSNIDKLPKFVGDDPQGLLSIKELPGGRVGVQDIYLTRLKGIDDLIVDPFVIKKDQKYLVETMPSLQQKKDALASWYLNIAAARSNGWIFFKDGVLVSAGSGQVERVGALEQAILKGFQKAMDREGIVYDPLNVMNSYELLENDPFQDSACSSDGFLPFSDSVQLLGRVGVGAVLQPFGSINDYVVIEGANKQKIAMMASLERCFGHF